jgi:hypothetical protein
MNALPMTPYLVAVVPAVLAGAVKLKGIPTKRIVAAFLYAIFLTLVGSWRGDVTSALAWLVAISSLLINGQQLFTTISKAV